MEKSNGECLKYWIGRLCDAHKDGNMQEVSRIAEIVKEYADWMKA